MRLYYHYYIKVNIILKNIKSNINQMLSFCSTENLVSKPHLSIWRCKGYYINIKFWVEEIKFFTIMI